MTIQHELLKETLDECERMLAEADAAAANIRQAANEYAQELTDGFVRVAASVEALHEEALSTREAARREADELTVRAHEHAAELQDELLAELDAETSERLDALDRHIAARLAEADRAVAELIARAETEAAERAAEAHDQADTRLADQVKASDESEAMVLERRAEAEHASATLLEEAGATADALVAEAEREAAERLQRADASVSALLLDAQAECTKQLAEAEREAAERLQRADASASALLLDAQAECTEQRAEADTVISQQLLEAYREARAIVDSAEAEAASRRVSDAPATALTTDGTTEPRDGEDHESTLARGTGPTPRRRARWARPLRLILVATALLMASGLTRMFVAETYTVASTSMEPALHDGERVIVNKLAYRLGEPERGDVVAVNSDAISNDLQGAEGETIVKRLIGEPGDVVAAREGRVVVNDEPFEEPWVKGAPTAPFGPVLVPEGTVFLLGDNRALSIDSRTFGVVPIDGVVGRVDAIFWPPAQIGRS